MSEKLKETPAGQKAIRLTKEWMENGYQSVGWNEEKDKDKVKVKVHLYPTFTYAVEPFS